VVINLFAEQKKMDAAFALVGSVYRHHVSGPNKKSIHGRKIGAS